MADSYDQFRRTLSERFQELKLAVDACLSASNGDQNQKRNAASKLASSASDYLSILAERDRPGWAKQLLSAARDAVQTFEAHVQLSRSIALFPQVSV